MSHALSSVLMRCVFLFLRFYESSVLMRFLFLSSFSAFLWICLGCTTTGLESDSNRIRIGFEPESFWICFEWRRRAFFLRWLRRDAILPTHKSSLGLLWLFFQKEKKNVMTGIRTYTVQKKGCAERIAPIGTLSQNGYGERQRVYNGSYLTTNTSALSGAP